MSNACLIDLPVELHHRIFDYLDADTILRSIRVVCWKFYAVVNSYDRYELNFRSMEQSYILFLSRAIHADKIRSLIIRNDIYHSPYERFLEYSGISFFPRVHSLAVHQRETFHCISTLQSFIGCSLISLSIYIRHGIHTIEVPRLFSVIAQFNLWKLYLHDFEFQLESISWISQHSLQHLTIKTCSYNVYREILRHFVHLRSFAINDWGKNDTNESIVQGRFRSSKVKIFIHSFGFKWTHS